MKVACLIQISKTNGSNSLGWPPKFGVPKAQISPLRLLGLTSPASPKNVGVLTGNAGCKYLTEIYNLFISIAFRSNEYNSYYAKSTGASMVYRPGAVKYPPQCFQGASILTPKRHTSDISHHLDRPFLKITGQAWLKHQENTRLSGNTSTKVLSLWLEAKNFAHLQTEQTKLAFTAFLQTRCCVKTLSQCSMGQGFPFENKNRHKIEFSKLTPFPWNTAIPLDIPSMPPSSRYMSPRPVCAEERAVCPQSTTIQGDLKHHVEPDSQLTWCT